MKKNEKKPLVEHMERVNEKVAVWPLWQQQMLKAKVSTNSRQRVKVLEEAVV
jgi:hypothetical protein